MSDRYNVIEKYFKGLKTFIEQEAFIIALELVGENIIANQLKMVAKERK